jgi:hypothetical protein
LEEQAAFINVEGRLQITTPFLTSTKSALSFISDFLPILTSSFALKANMISCNQVASDLSVGLTVPSAFSDSSLS